MLNLNEEWKALPDIDYFDDIKIERYLISSTGAVMNKETGKILKPFIRYGKFPVMSLSRRSSCAHRTFSVSLLVMLAFDYRPDFKDLWVVNLDCDTMNTDIHNLMWSDGYRFGKQIMFLPAINVFNFTQNNNYYQEIWSPLPGIKEFEGIRIDWYLVSSYGRIFSRYLSREIMPSVSPDGKGYYNIELTGDNDFHKCYRINRIVALTYKYIENSELYQVNHINGNTRDNFVGNLEWVLPIENTHHAFMTGLSNTHIGENNNTATIPDALVNTMLNLYITGMQSKEASKICNINSDYADQIFNVNSRIVNIINFILSNGYTDIKDCFTQDELQLLMNAANLDLAQYKDYIRSIGIMDNTIRFLDAILIKRCVNNPNNWYSKMYFYNTPYYSIYK